MTVQVQEKLRIPEDTEIQKELGFVEVNQLASQQADPATTKVADEWMKRLLSVDLVNPAQQQEVREAVENAGANVEVSLARKSGLLKEQIKILASEPEGSSVAKSLIALKVNVDKVNPNRYKLLEPGGVGRVFAWIPGVGTTMNSYFTRWQSAGGVIDSIVMQIREGAKELLRDNDTLRADQIEMRSETLRLQKFIQTLMLVNEKLSAEIEKMEAGSERRKFMEEEVLFTLRQRIGDLQQTLTVNQQGVISYEFVIRTNRELIRSAKRCETLTVKALEIAVVLALALAKQRMVLRSIQAVDQTTAELMVQNARNLKTQGSEIFKMSAEQSISIEALASVYADLDSAFEEASEFKQAALPKMAQRMLAMNKMSEKGEKIIDQMERGNSKRSTLTLDIDAE
ncbi:MAG: toxic anion resistance protein [Candidatus Paceibacterota bacterium]|jgi:uncharacterized protein YaaN involved in tellurite resistance